MSEEIKEQEQVQENTEEVAMQVQETQEENA